MQNYLSDVKKSETISLWSGNKLHSYSCAAKSRTPNLSLKFPSKNLIQVASLKY